MIPSAVSDRVTDTKLLASIIEKQEARIVEPWRTELEAFRVQNRNITETTSDELKTLAIDLAKNGSLSADEAMSLTYILFGSAEAHLFYANLLMTKKGIERIQFHNWFVAESSGEHFLRAYGAKIKNLTWPLFPPDKVFSAINLRLMLEHSSPHGGGDNMPSCYRRDPTGSGCPLPVLMDNQGHPYVELSKILSSGSSSGFSCSKNRFKIVVVRVETRSSDTNRSTNFNNINHHNSKGMFNRKGTVNHPQAIIHNISSSSSSGEDTVGAEAVFEVAKLMGRRWSHGFFKLSHGQGR